MSTPAWMLGFPALLHLLRDGRRERGREEGRREERGREGGSKGGREGGRRGGWRKKEGREDQCGKLFLLLSNPYTHTYLHYHHCHQSPQMTLVLEPLVWQLYCSEYGPVCICGWGGGGGGGGVREREERESIHVCVCMQGTQSV